MKLSKLLILVLSCQKNLYTDQIYRNYFNKNKVKYLFIVGGYNKNKINKDVMELKSLDNYENLNLKMIEAFKIIKRKYKNYIFLKIDDDTLINIHKIKKIKINFDYGGVLFPGIFKNKDYIFAFGGGYFLSYKSVCIFVKNFKKYIDERFFTLGEDRLLGYVLSCSKKDLIFVKLGKIINETNKNMFVLLNNLLIHPVNFQYIKNFYSSKLKNFYYKNPKGLMLPNPPVPPCIGDI